MPDEETGKFIEAQTPPAQETEPSSFEIFSVSSRSILQFAEEEAKRLNHDFTGTRHLLLALVKKVPTAASETLKNLGINLTKIQPEIEKAISQQPSIEPSNDGLTSAAKQIIELSIEEAKRLDSQMVLPEHILMALVRHERSIANKLLKDREITPEKIYIELIRLYTHPR